MTQHAAIEIAVRKRMRQVRGLARTSADGVLDRETLLKALQQIERVERHALRNAGFGGGGPGSAPPVAAQWQQEGPAPIREHLGAGPTPVAGRVYDIAIDPRGSSDQTIYAATVGGIWKSLDGGATWAPKIDRLPWSQMGAVALDPVYPDIVYAGGVIGPGPSLFRSDDDGGETWSTIGQLGHHGRQGVQRRIDTPQRDRLFEDTRRCRSG
ncbi:WD40/YVTN/BNR-like repeat-containing protein [Streptomyces sp. NPDC051452]|uniref:WD40/YVTN/BNR-like repeat-containing protein n=1 Tax=Streptomyces sp. NPDC051452 TaxID=3365654 RepID=UPI00379249EC